MPRHKVVATFRRVNTDTYLSVCNSTNNSAYCGEVRLALAEVFIENITWVPTCRAARRAVVLLGCRFGVGVWVSQEPSLIYLDWVR